MSEWQKVKIGDICTVTKGSAGIQKAIDGDFPMVTLAQERRSHNEFQFDCEAVLIPLVSSTGHGHASMKRVHYQEGKFALGSILCAVIPDDTNSLNPKYLHIYLSYLKDKLLVPLMRGAANVSLSITNIKTVEVIVPPIERQLEIIELEKSLRGQKQKLDEKNLSQKSTLKNLRQQILQDAISGKLTADWRAENSDIEPASELLKKIKAEKEKLIAEKKMRKEKPLPPILEDEIPFELPEGWAWCRLGEVIDFQNGYAFKSFDFKGSDFGVIRIGDMQNGEIMESSMRFIDKKTAEKVSDNFVAQKGDILIAMSGATTGKIAINNSTQNYYINQRVGKINVLYNKTLKSYLINLLTFNRKQFLTNSNGSIIDNLSTEQIKGFLIPLPPLSEQKAIVAKVEKLMQHLDQLEEKITQNEKDTEMLMQAFLGEVFRK